MGAKRTKNLDLPENVHFKGKSYYFVKRVDGKRVWLNIGNDLSQVEELKQIFIERKYSWQDEFPGISKQLFSSAFHSSKKRGITFDLTQEDIAELMNRSAGICEVSGLRFSSKKIDGCVRSPWKPSIDRIKSTLPYTKSNCRIVCVAVNIALGEWGIDVLKRITKGVNCRTSTK